MIKLPELRAYITDTLKAHGKEIFDNPQQVYTSYRFEPQENEELRFDVMAGSSCFQPLVANYYNGSTELFDRLNGFGAQAVFIAFPMKIRKKVMGRKCWISVMNWKTVWRRNCLNRKVWDFY